MEIRHVCFREFSTALLRNFAFCVEHNEVVNVEQKIFGKKRSLNPTFVLHVKKSVELM